MLITKEAIEKSIQELDNLIESTDSAWGALLDKRTAQPGNKTNWAVGRIYITESTGPSLLALKTFVSQVKAGASWDPQKCRLEQSL